VTSRAALLAAAAAALGVFGAWEALAALAQARVAGRLAAVSAPLGRALRRGEAPTRGELVRLVAVGAATLLAAGWLVAGLLTGLALAAAGPFAISRVLRARRRRWRRAFAAGAAAAARALADALSAGHSVRGAIGVAGRHGGVPEPAGGELRRAAAALAVGERTDAALETLRRRAADPGWDTIVAAVLLQREAGGDLAGLLRSTAGALEDAARVRADAASATAQARFTAKLVAALPLIAAGLGELAAPGSLATIAGRPATAAPALAAFALQVVAFLVIRRLVRGALR
jgi:tight adherence protein B